MFSFVKREEFERGHELRCFVAQQGVDAPDMRDFVGVGDVLAVPRDQHITTMEGGEGEMVGVGGSLDGHDFVPVVGLDDFSHFVGVGQKGQLGDETEAAAAFEFRGRSSSSMTTLEVTRSSPGSSSSHQRRVQLRRARSSTAVRVSK